MAALKIQLHKSQLSMKFCNFIANTHKIKYNFESEAMGVASGGAAAPRALTLAPHENF